MRRVLILRERAEAERTAELVREAGCEPCLLPLSRIELLGPPMPDGAFAGVIVTSRHAVPWVERSVPTEGTTLLAVGRSTAALLHEQGYPKVLTGAGRARDLARSARSLVSAGGERFLYAAGRVRLSDLEASFAAEGLPLEVVDVYDTLDIEPSDGAIASVASDGPLDAVLVLSRGQARGLERLLRRAPDLLKRDAICFCLSGEIAAELAPERRLHALEADHPRLDQLVAMINRWNETAEAASFRCSLRSER